ncbi:hypothetical protein Vafri_8688 [Volvox africanus]|uniref:C2H2-type domain-containing protein n=2 Tax=Volvox africanus TaxID=51714 RepID=A0A8J4B730_9CHLO|nr:hypothetical protein Vafri_8688 [Volvox africanus]
MSAEGSDVSLHRGIHLFTHPTLIYSVINSRQPRFLRRNLSYASCGTVVPSSECATTLGSALEVRLGNLTMEGANLPAQVTLVVALCEAATTGRDFKPIRAVAVTLSGRDAGQPAESAGAGLTGLVSGVNQQGDAGTLLLPLPKRQLTRPMLLILASDRHPDMKALVPLDGKRGRNLQAGLRAGGTLLGLLPELCPVWAARQPLDGLIHDRSRKSDVSSIRSPAIGEVAPPSHVDIGTSGAAATADPVPRPGMRVQAQFQHGRIARSKCSVTANGTTLVATLLNLSLSQDLAASNLRLGRQPNAARNGVQQQQQQQQQQSSCELASMRLTRRRSREAAALGSTAGAGAGAAPEGRTAVVGGRLVCSNSGGVLEFGAGNDVGRDSGMTSVEDEVQIVRLSSLTISLELGIRQVVGTASDGGKPKAHQVPRQQAAAVANIPGAHPVTVEGKESIVEFRYVYDDASWSGAGGAASRKRLQQQQEQLLRTEQQLLQLQQQRERGAVGDAKGSQGPGDTSVTVAGAPGSGFWSGADRAVWMKQQMSRARDSELEAEAEAVRRNELEQQQIEQIGSAAVGAAASAPVLERCFVEEMRVPVGTPFSCPLCAVTCRSFQGLQQHLPASHGLYRYTYPEAPEDGGEEEAGPDGAAGGDGGGADTRSATNDDVVGPVTGLPTPGGRAIQRRAQLRKYVVEVRLPAEAVDPARGDLVVSEEDVLLVTQEGRPVWLSLRSWSYSRASGIVSPVYTDAVGDVVPTTAASAPGGAPGAGALPSLLLPSGTRFGGRTRRGGGRGEGSVMQEDADPAAAIADEAREACAQQQQQQEQQQADKGRAQGRGSSGGAEPTLVRVPVESIRKSAAGPAVPEPEAAAAAEGGAVPFATTAAAGPSVPPALFAVGAHPPGRRYFHCRTLMPGATEEMFGAYDSDDETDHEEWEAAFDRHMAHSTRITPLRASERRFFKLWSAFARQRPIYADYVTRRRCLEFARENGVLIRAEPELRAALVVHLMLLHEMNLVDPRVIHRCLQIVDGRISSTAEEDERFLATRGLEGVGRAASAAVAAAVAPTAGVGAAVGGSGGAVVTAAIGDDDGEEQPPVAGRGGGSSGSGDDGDGDGDGVEEGRGDADENERVLRGQSAAPRGRRRRRAVDATAEEPSRRPKRRRRNDGPAETGQEGAPVKDSCPGSVEAADVGQPSGPGAAAVGNSAAAVEAGAVEAEGNASSPASAGAGTGDATTATGNAPPQRSLTAPGAPECVDPASTLLVPHCEAAQPTRPPGHLRQGQDAQQQQRQSEQQPQPQGLEGPAPKVPPTTRVTPALSWSLQKRTSRALAPPPAVLMLSHQRPLPNLRSRVGIPTASGPAAPSSAGAMQHGGTARMQPQAQPQG